MASAFAQSSGVGKLTFFVVCHYLTAVARLYQVKPGGLETLQLARPSRREPRSTLKPCHARNKVDCRLGTLGGIKGSFRETKVGKEQIFESSHRHCVLLPSRKERSITRFSDRS